MGDRRADLPRSEGDAVNPPEFVADAGGESRRDEVAEEGAAFDEAREFGSLERAIDFNDAGVAHERIGVGDVGADRATYRMLLIGRCSCHPERQDLGIHRRMQGIVALGLGLSVFNRPH